MGEGGGVDALRVEGCNLRGVEGLAGGADGRNRLGHAVEGVRALLPLVEACCLRICWRAD